MPHDPNQEGEVYTFSGGEVVNDGASKVTGPKRKRRRWPRRLLVGSLVLALVIAGGGWLVIRHLTGNIRTVVLSGSSASIDAANGKPLDILILGSDTRSTAADCKIGGDCPTSASPSAATAIDGNADVEMLVHLSADRKHAEIVSIPRDTVVDIPDCTDSTGKTVPAHRQRINSSMENGPDCTVRTVEKLTGLTIPHVAVVDFAGVVSMTNALGGVPVCVDNNVYDPYSHLKLTKGTHTVQGLSALEFVRTRHGFGDGGDVGRTGAQHIFLSSMIRTLRSTSTLANPVKMYEVADAATKALTVDKGLAGAANLTALYEQLNKVPTDAIDFVTMPHEMDPYNSAALIPSAAATTLFQRLASDSYATATPTASASSSPSASSSSTPAASDSSPTPAPTSTKATESSCAHVSTSYTVSVNGVGMTPIQAFDASTSVALSAK